VTSVDLKPPQSPSGATKSLPPTRKQKFFLGFLLAIAIIAVYYPVHWQPFANYDDADYVTDNFHVKAGLQWTTVKWALTTHDAANWHPVTWLSHALDAQIFGMEPAGPHDVNVLFHIVNAMLLFWVLLRATGSVGRSWMVAALFALHPINVESVAWISERKNLLSMFFFLLALGAYRWYASKPRLDRYLIVAALVALGLMSKPQVITAPFVLLLWDYWPLQRLGFRLKQTGADHTTGAMSLRSPAFLILEKIPLLALCLVSATFTLQAQSTGGATSSYGHMLRMTNAIVSYARYLGKAVWPSHLALFYPYPLQPYPLWQVGGDLLILLAITLAVLVASRRRYLTVGWLWFMGTLVPMIGVIQVGTQAMADRYAYLSFVGLFIMVCWLVGDWAAQAQVAPVLLRAVNAAVLIAFALVAHRQVGYWNDHITLWTHTLEVTHDNWVGENNLGTALLRMGRPEEAIPHFRAAAALEPTDPNSLLNIGTYEQGHGNTRTAIDLYVKAADIARNPRTKGKAYNNLGYAYDNIGDFPHARDSFEKAVRADPEFVGAWISLGLMAQKMGDLRLAISSYSRALQIHPSDFGYLLLAGAFEQSGDNPQASTARQQAARISDNIISAQHYADKLLAR
jgi:tetratricopeptide (TPR) repeat protein